MTSALPSRHTLTQLAGVALLACGNVATVYGGWQLREAFGLQWDNPLLRALPPFLLLCLPLVLLYAVFEFRGFKLSRQVGLPVRAGDSPWMSSVAFGVLGAGWVFLRGGLADRAATKAEAALAKPTADTHHKPGPGREAAETVVFVVVLVLMLKLFVVEAFVIPTGSMAETLYGYRKTVTCPKCLFEFPVNASDEADPQGGRKPDPTTGYCCPNCRYTHPTEVREKGWGSGDRVLVGKFFGVQRGDVVVFKYPDAPQTNQTAQNYIKRLVGMPGETIAIYNGDLYFTRGLTYPKDETTGDGAPRYPRPADPNDLWRATYQPPNGGPFIWPTRKRVMADQPVTGPELEALVQLLAGGRDEPGTDKAKAATIDPAKAATILSRYDYRYPNTQAAVSSFEDSLANGFPSGRGFEIVRKPDDLVLAMRRIVYDNDHPALPLVELHQRELRDATRDPDKDVAKPRWWKVKNDDAGWAADDEAAPKKFAHTGGEFGWVRYQHLVPPGVSGWSATSPPPDLAPQEITNFMGYNAGIQENDKSARTAGSNHWVGDLILECQATVGDGGVVVLQLCKGETSYRAEFDGGTVRLKMFPNDEEYTRPDGNKAVRRRAVPVGDDAFTLTGKPSGVKAGGTHRLRFANVDCRLRVWVDDRPIDFGGKADYAPPKTDGPTKADKEWPACVGASGTASVSGLKLWRDTHYVNERSAELPTAGKRIPLDTYFVQPGHYLCMGDNSSQSSDGRMWGLVPERLMLGRAVFTFFPVDRLGFIR